MKEMWIEVLQDANACIENDDTIPAGYNLLALAQSKMKMYRSALATLQRAALLYPVGDYREGAKELVASYKKRMDDDYTKFVSEAHKVIYFIHY